MIRDIANQAFLSELMKNNPTADLKALRRLAYNAISRGSIEEAKRWSDEQTDRVYDRILRKAKEDKKTEEEAKADAEAKAEAYKARAIAKADAKAASDEAVAAFTLKLYKGGIMNFPMPNGLPLRLCKVGYAAKFFSWGTALLYGLKEDDIIGEHLSDEQVETIRKAAEPKTAKPVKATEPVMEPAE